MKLKTERSRIRAALVNAGGLSFPEADKKLEESKLAIVLVEEVAATPAGQAAFLTAVATGARCFGEVWVEGALDVPLVVPIPLRAKTLGKAAAILGARTATGALPGRKIFIGHAGSPASGWSLQAWWDGWWVGTAPGRSAQPIGRSDCALSGVAGGALAVGQAFLAEQGDPRAGWTVQKMSLWAPDAAEDDSGGAGPTSFNLPEELWLVGLGNLGQAYMWSISMLPFADPRRVLLFLQDDDSVEKDNWGTSILVRRRRYGLLKTRLAEIWADSRRFRVRRIDRRLDQFTRRTQHEPAIALAGLDRMPPRRLLGLPGFEYVIDAGLGATYADYRRFRVNVFDCASDPAVHFAEVEDQTDRVVKELLALPVYQELMLKSKDGGCGAAMLAEKSVAVPFVSAFVGAIVVTQAIRCVSGLAPYMTLTGDLGDLRTIRAALGREPVRLQAVYGPAISWLAVDT